nr:nucleoside recognition domain-containing protein [Maliibacterium massiliense]
MLRKSLRYCFLILLILFVCFPQQVMSACLQELMLWATAVVPSLLPFFICAGVITRLGVAEDMARVARPIMRPIFGAPGDGAYVMMLGMLSGYPMAAKLCASLIAQKRITPRQAERILCFSSTAGPAFVLGTVASSLMGMPQIGWALALGHYGSALLLGMLHRLRYGDVSGENGPSILRATPAQPPMPWGQALGESARDASVSLLIVGIFIAFYASVLAVLESCGLIDMLIKALTGIGVHPGVARTLLVGTMEMTGGCQAAAGATLSVPLRMGMLGAVLSFGGFSIHSQTFTFLAGSGVRSGHYLLCKLAHGVLAFGLTFALGAAFFADAPAMAMQVPSVPLWPNALLNSVMLCCAFMFLLCLMPTAKKRRAGNL